MQKQKQGGGGGGVMTKSYKRRLPTKLLKNQKEKWLKAAREGMMYLKKRK